MALEKKTKRLLAYAAILGGAAVLALTFFTISQFEKAKYQASVSVELMSKNKYNQLSDAYLDEHPEIDKESKDASKAVINDASEANTYYEAATYWNEISEHFNHVTTVNYNAYRGTAIPAYIFSMSTLVAFGLILKHAEKAKDKEDEEAVLRPQQKKEAKA